MHKRAPFSISPGDINGSIQCGDGVVVDRCRRGDLLTCYNPPRLVAKPSKHGSQTACRDLTSTLAGDSRTRHVIITCNCYKHVKTAALPLHRCGLSEALGCDQSLSLAVALAAGGQRNRVISGQLAVQVFERRKKRSAGRRRTVGKRIVHMQDQMRGIGFR
jgi:hypothetical protein